MSDEDEVETRIGQAIMLHRGGDRVEARDRFARLWEEVSVSGDAFHRCTLAHYMADVQDDPRQELAWDLRALEAAQSLTDGRAGRAGPPAAVRAFFPSLHLNLAADYLRLGGVADARRHLEQAEGASGALGDDAYGHGIRAAIARVGTRIAEAASRPTGPDQST